MNILLDHNVPAYLVGVLPNCSTTYSRGWQEISNGELLHAAEAAGFDLLITIDKGFQHQQRLGGRHIAVAIMIAPDQKRHSFEALARLVIAALPEIRAGEVATFGPA